jgi:hypothetical protein
MRERNVKLRKHVARRQRHFLEISRVPRAQDNPTIVRVLFQFPHHFGQLVDSLARVVCVAVLVLCAEVAPLETVDGAEVAFFAVREADGVEVLA